MPHSARATQCSCDTVLAEPSQYRWACQLLRGGLPGPDAFLRPGHDVPDQPQPGEESAWRQAVAGFSGTVARSVHPSNLDPAVVLGRATGPRDKVREMNAKRIGARLIAATVTAGAMMSVAAPAWAATEDAQPQTPADMLQRAGDLSQAEAAVCDAVEKANGEGATIMDIEFVGKSSCPKSGILGL